MDEPLPDDVVARVQRDFGAQAEVIIEILMAFRSPESPDYLSDRLIRCVVVAAKGVESRIWQMIELGLIDGRDLVVSGEYDAGGRRLRNLTRSFDEAELDPNRPPRLFDPNDADN